MKKILTAAVFSAAAIAFAASGPELLKDKASFENTDLFEPPEVFADRAANVALLRDYEANPAAYKSSQLLPIAVCYLSFNDLPKAKTAFETFLTAKPNNVRALRTLGTISLLMKDVNSSIEYYKKAIAAGDEKSVVFLGSAYIMSGKAAEIEKYLPTLKKLAKENLEAFNVAFIYAGRDKEKLDEQLAKELLASADPRKLLESATPDGMSTVLRLYLATRKIWDSRMAIVPARSAALAEAWALAMEMYKNILADRPNDPLALRGMSVVAFRTGDIMGAADYIMRAYNNGEKAAAMDGVELFLLSKDFDVWKKFSKLAADMKPTVQVRAGLVQYAAGRDDCSDMFYFAALGENSELLYKDEAVSKLLEEGAKKYGRDKRSSEVLKKLAEAKPAAKPAK